MQRADLLMWVQDHPAAVLEGGESLQDGTIVAKRSGAGLHAIVILPLPNLPDSKQLLRMARSKAGTLHKMGVQTDGGFLQATRIEVCVVTPEEAPSELVEKGLRFITPSIAVPRVWRF